MVDLVGAFSGFNKQQDADERRRLELANAFSAFKQANPYATPMEMQSFIDQAAAGRNYLAGGMPSSDVLNVIGQRNAAALKAKQEKEASAALTSRLSQMSQVNQMIPALAKAFSGELTTEGEDGLVVPSDAFKTFVSDLGLPENLSSQITPGAFSEVYRGLTTQYVDDAMRIIKNSGGNIDLDAITSQLRVPKNLIEGFKKQVTTEQGRIKTNFELTNKKEFINQMADAMKIGPVAVENVANTMKQLGAVNGFNVTPEYLNSVKNEAMRLVEVRDKEEQIANDARLNEKEEKFTEAIEADNDLRNIVYGGVTETVGTDQVLIAKRLMREKYQNMFRDIDPALKERLEAKIETMLQSMIGNAQISQDLKIEKRMNTLEEKAAGSRKTILDNNQNVINLVFSGKSDAAKPFKLAAMNLAQRYNISKATAITLAQAFDNLSKSGKPMTSIELEKEGEAILQMMGVATIDEATTQLKDNIMSEGSYDKSGKTITFEKFFEDMESKSTQALETYSNELDQTLQSQAQPREKLMQLKATLDKLNRYKERFNLRLANAKKNSYGEEKFITAGTPAYDDDRVENYQKGYLGNVQAITEKIQKEIAQIENDISQSSAPIDMGTRYSDAEVSDRKEELEAIHDNPTSITTNPVTGQTNSLLAKMVEEFLEVGSGPFDGQDMIDILAGTDGATISMDDLQFFRTDPYNFIRRYNPTFFRDYIEQNGDPMR